MLWENRCLPACRPPFKADLEFLLDPHTQGEFLYSGIMTLGIFCLKTERASKDEIKKFFPHPPTNMAAQIFRKVENKIAPA